MIRLKKKKTGPTPPPERVDQRFRSFSNEDLYTAFEHGVSHAIAEMDQGRSDPKNRDAHLETCLVNLTEAFSAVDAMRGRL